VSAGSSRFTQPSTRLALHIGTLMLGIAGVLSLAHFLFREVAPAIDRLEAPQRWWSGIVAFVLLACAMVTSAVAMTSSVLARLARSRTPPSAAAGRASSSDPGAHEGVKR